MEPDHKTFKVALTGGGTLGHIVPGLAVASKLRDLGCSVFWIGSTSSSEKAFIEKRGVQFYPVSSGKLRRYFSMSNFAMPFKVAAGFFQARKILKALRPSVLFSKGGFVSVPVARAAHSLGIPVVTHESDSSCGLATKLIARYCTAVCLGDLRCTIKTKAAVHYTGNPVREDIKGGDAQRFGQKNGLHPGIPVVLVLGGSQGALKLNETIASAMSRLYPRCQVVLQTGKGKLSGHAIEGLFQFETFDSDLGDALAASDLVVSRAGAGAIAELVSLAKPVIYIPLGLDASRGDQISNARAEEEAGRAEVSGYEKAVEKILELIDNESKRMSMSEACAKVEARDSALEIAKIVLEVASDGSECR